MPIALEKAGCLAAPGDNAAIASQRLEAGSGIAADTTHFTIAHTVLEGHRFAIEPIDEGGPLLSWSLPFGKALRRIEPGDYLCNASILTALRERRGDFTLPDEANFADFHEPPPVDVSAIEPAAQVEPAASPRFFEGYARGRRGVGTRNTILVLGTSSLTGTYARTLAERFKEVGREFSNVDGVVAVAHTEGGEAGPNNLDFVLRALRGFVVHPNIAAVLAVDFGDEPIHNAMLRHFMAECGDPLEGTDAPLLRFKSLGGSSSLAASLDQGAALLQSWLEPVNALARTKQSVQHLKLALQCGGSDAFSGVCANPVAGWVAKQTIRCGGAANLAETDELIGAETYVLQSVRDAATARAFLKKVEIFRDRAARHGHSAEGNPSGGNKYRGLYNIAIKSIGAARKKDPLVRLDEVIDYAEPMTKPGFYFMDSPGNDLESVAGQVASGANLILFTTGNGSITNFPFVPTIKIVSTTGRFDMIRNDMDVNAGRFLDGVPLDELGAETFELALSVASGQRSAGEKAGHAQVQLWRNWRQGGHGRDANNRVASKPNGRPLSIAAQGASAATFRACRSERGYATDQVGVVVPTSLCSGQIARLIVEKLNAMALHLPAVSRYVTFVHTEGCGVSSGDGENLYLRTLIGHAAHPMVRCCLFLEHGCEKTHNDAMGRTLEEYGLAAQHFGWASVQMDGGIDPVVTKVVEWFDRKLSGRKEPENAEVGLDRLRLGIFSDGPIDDSAAATLGHLAARVVASGGVVVVPANASWLGSSAFTDTLRPEGPVVATLALGQFARHEGLHVMDTPTRHSTETLTGLCATGVEVILAHVGVRPLQAHPLVPMLQVSSGVDVADVDHVLDPANPDQAASTDDLLDLVLQVASRRVTPKLFGQGYTDFQVTRGLTGISL